MMHWPYNEVVASVAATVTDVRVRCDVRVSTTKNISALDLCLVHALFDSFFHLILSYYGKDHLFLGQYHIFYNVNRGQSCSYLGVCLPSDGLPYLACEDSVLKWVVLFTLLRVYIVFFTHFVRIYFERPMPGEEMR